MKRKRGEEEEEEDKTNHLFPMILSQPEILVIIFESLGDYVLNFLKILYQYFHDNDTVLHIMDDYLEENCFIEKLSAILFKVKVKRLQYLVDDGDLDEYCYKLNAYKKYRHLKNLVKFGYCCHCRNLPQGDITLLIGVKNRNIIELDSKYVYLCDKCSDQELFYTPTQLIDNIGADYITMLFATKYGIRYGYDNGLKFLKDDVNNILTRKSDKRYEIIINC